MAKLKDLLKGFDYQCIRGNLDVEVGEVVYDSRKVTSGDLFICIRGAKADGNDS